MQFENTCMSLVIFFQALKILKNSDLKPYFIFVCPPQLDRLRQQRTEAGELLKVSDILHKWKKRIDPFDTSSGSKLFMPMFKDPCDTIIWKLGHKEVAFFQNKNNTKANNKNEQPLQVQWSLFHHWKLIKFVILLQT